MKSEEFKIGVIYMYTSPSGKVYIGQTINESSRKGKHKRETSKTDTHFGKAIRKYGFENFKYEAIIKFKPTSDRQKLKRVLNALEMRYIRIYKANNPEFGYNITKGGDGTIGLKHNEETKEYIGECSKRMWSENREKMLEVVESRKGVTQSEETKVLKREKAKGKKKVIQCDLEENVLKEFESVHEAARYINTGTSTIKCDSNKISECCNEKRKTHRGFIWKFQF